MTRDALPPEGQAVWDRIAAVRHGVRGPYSVLIHNPALADRVRAVEDYFRFEAELPAADRELVILTTAREAGARFAWARHEVRAQEVGTRAEAVEIVRAGGRLDGLTQRERVLVEVARALLRTRGLSDDIYRRAEAELGERQLLEVVTLTGHYTLIGYLINGYAVEEPSDTRTF